MKLSKEQIVAMAVAAIAEETGEDITTLRVRSFREIHMSSLAQYIEDNHITYQKYQLPSTGR